MRYFSAFTGVGGFDLGMPPDWQCVGMSEINKYANMVLKDGMDIRYLTPLECERLMGWEDNWTKYGINEKGETIELSDNCRYNLIGNGVVPQVVREIISKEVME